MNKHVKTCQLQGTIQTPSSKSYGQRALLASALNVENPVSLKNIGDSDDAQNMCGIIESCGAVIHQLGNGIIEVTGVGELPLNLQVNCGESGLALRLTAFVISAFAGEKQFNGSGSLLSRDHSFFTEYLPQMGVLIEGKKSKLPFLLKGKLKGGRYTVDGSQSSQYISGLLMALPLLDEDSELTVTNLLSKPYVEMTLHTLESFGIRMEHLDYKRFIIKGKQNYKCSEYVVENDWSSASYWLVAAAIGHDVNLRGLNLESKQADTQILQALKLSNCHVRIKDGLLHVEGSNKIAFDFDATHCPDLFPVLVTLAAFCKGTSTIKGALRLKNKESDRGRVLLNEFKKIGLRIELNEDEMKIYGGTEMYSAEVDSNMDHRIAMCLAITGTKIKDGLVIKNAGSVTKSYKNFWEDLEKLITH